MMFSVELKTVFAAKGSRNILNSAYLLEGMLKTFPVSKLSRLMCPPTMYTSCKEIRHHSLKLCIKKCFDGPGIKQNWDICLPELERSNFS